MPLVRLYDLVLDCELRLPTGLLPAVSSGDPDVIVTGGDALEVPVTGGSPVTNPEHTESPDGSDVLTWPGLLRFTMTPDGRRMTVSRGPGAGPEAMASCLAGPAFSFTLLRRGVENLHATAVAYPEGSVALMGGSGTGKSTLAAMLIAEGARLLTDDLLVFRPDEEVPFCPAGPARLKLDAGEAARLLPAWSPLEERHPFTGKELVPIPPSHAVAPGERVPLRAILLTDRTPRGAVEAPRLRRLDPAEAAIELASNTFNPILTGGARLRTHFDLVTGLAGTVPVYDLALPDGRDRLGDVPALVRAAAGT